MKVIVNSLVFMLLISSKACTNTLADKLHGEWECVDTGGEVPDILLFHPSGRYIVFNDAATSHPWLPIIEKGDWAIKDKVIVLTNREFFVPQEFFVLPEDSMGPVSKSLKMHIKRISKEELVLGACAKDRNIYAGHYKRFKPHVEIEQQYTGTGAAIEELVLPPPGGATILKLSYEFSALNEAPSELIVESQDGYEVFRKKIIATNGVEETEILLADMPIIEDLTLLADIPIIEDLPKLIFRVNARSSSTTWKLKAKIY